MEPHLHLIGTLNNVVIERTDDLRDHMMRIATECSLNVRGECFVQFEPHGATGVLVLSESHFSAHTFVEETRIQFDIYCCSSGFNPFTCFLAIEKEFGCTDGIWKVIQR